MYCAPSAQRGRARGVSKCCKDHWLVGTVMAVLSRLWSSRREVAAAAILGGGVLFYINRRLVDER